MSYAPESVFDELYTSSTSLSGRIGWGELFTMHRPDGGFVVAVAMVFCVDSPNERVASAAGGAVAAPDDGASSGTALVVVVVVVDPPGGRTSSG